MLRADGLDVDRAMVLVVDVQASLLPFIRGHEGVVAAGRKLLEGVRVFGVPVLGTEQYPKGIGRTVPAIREGLEANRASVLEKMTFSACREPATREALQKIDRPQVIVIGIEAHVCVQQTVLDLRAMDYDVFVCADAVGSRGRLDYKHSLHRMRQAGAFVTTVESALFELCDRCGTDQFKAMLEVVKAHPPADD